VILIDCNGGGGGAIGCDFGGGVNPRDGVDPRGDGSDVTLRGNVVDDVDVRFGGVFGGGGDGIGGVDCCGGGVIGSCGGDCNLSISA
jgi:hypothetical protein